MESEHGGHVVFDGTSRDLEPEDEVGEEEEDADGEGEVGVDDGLGSPKFGGEELGRGRGTWCRWKWRERESRHDTRMKPSSNTTIVSAMPASLSPGFILAFRANLRCSLTRSNIICIMAC